MSSPSPHVLASGFGPQYGEIPIPPVKAEAICSATKRVNDILYAEQKFDILVENYVELENALLHAGVHYMVHQTMDTHYFEVQRDLFNRLLSNLLSAARAYLDYVPQASNRMLGQLSGATSRCKAECAQAYDSYVGYRVMEGLRNFAQHEGLPVQALRVTGDEIGVETRTVVSFYAIKSAMREMKVFKHAVQIELDAMPGAGLDLKHMMREYLSGLAHVHDALRTEIAARASEWLSTISAAATEFNLISPLAPADSIGVVDRTKSPPEFTNLPVTVWKHVLHLRQKNGYVGDFHLKFVSGQLVKEEPGQRPTEPNG